MSLKKEVQKSLKPEQTEDQGTRHASETGGRDSPEEARRQKDIHELIKSRKETEKQLSARLSLLQGIIESADVAIFSLDTHYRYTNFNMRHVTDIRDLYDTEPSAGVNISHVFSIEKDLGHIHDLIKKVLDGESLERGMYLGDNARNRRYFSISGYPLRNNAEVVTGAAIVLREETSKKRAERDLTDRVTMFSRFADTSSDLIYSISVPDGACEYVSPSLKSLTGYSREEFCQHPDLIQRIIHPSWRDSFLRHQAVFVKEKIAQVFEYQIIRKDGNVRWVRQRNTPVRDTTGRLVGIDSHISDITEAKETLDNLTEREERFQRVFESTGTGLILVDAETHTVTDANPRFLELIGASRQEVIGYRDHSFIGPADAGTDYDVDTTRTVESQTMGLRTSSGKTLPVAVTTVPAEISGKNLLIESISDISDQKRTCESLQENLQYYRTFIAKSGDGICRYDIDCPIMSTLSVDEQISLVLNHGRIAECNDTMARIAGYEHGQDMTGRTFGEVEGRINSRVPEILKTFIQGGYHIENIEYEACGRDGGTHWFSDTMTGMVKEGAVIQIWITRRDISHRKHAEVILNEDSECYDALVARSGECVFTLDSDGKFIDANRPLLDLTGYRREELLMLNMFSLLEESQRDRARREITSCSNGVRMDNTEYTLQHRDGHPIVVEMTGSTIFHDGKPVAFQGIFHDISILKQSEETLRKELERLKTVLEYSPDIIYSMDFSGVLTSVSSTVPAVLGYAQKEIVGKNLLEFVTTDSRILILDDLAQKKAGRYQEERYVIDIISKSGLPVPFEVNSRIRHNEYSDSDIIGIAREISERQKTEDALRESEQCYRDLFRKLPSVAVLGFHPDHSIVYWNKASTVLYGYPEEEALGKDVRDLLLPPGERDAETERCARIVESGCPLPAVETVYIRKGGEEVLVYSGTSLVNIPGKNPVIFRFGIDVSPWRFAERAVREENRHLREILDNAPFSTVQFILDEDTNLMILWGNREAKRIFSADFGSCAGMTLENTIPAFDGTEIPGAFREVARTGTSFRCKAFHHQSGDVMHVFEISAVQPVKNEVVAFFCDITERTAVMDELLRNEVRFRSIVQNSSDIFLILDRDRKLVFSSSAFSTLLGYPEGRQDHIDFTGLAHPDDRERILSYLGRIRGGARGEPPIEYRIRTVRGDYLFVESVAASLQETPDLDDTIITMHLIHERKVAEQSLQEREEEFRFILRHSDDAIFLSSVTPSGLFGTTILVNTAATRQTGFDEDELRQKSLVELCSRDIVHKSHAVMMELFTKGEVRLEDEFIQKNGASMPVEISIQLAMLRDKTFTVAVARDISRRKRDEHALQIVNQKLQLMNIVAFHKIQNKIITSGQLMERSENTVDEGKLKNVISTLDGVLAIVQRQLQHIREYQEMERRSPQWINLTRLLPLAASSLGLGAIRLTLDSSEVELYCNSLIEKVFFHLMDNTIKHGVKATEIRISSRETPEGLRIIYDDDGIGISSEKKKDLFTTGFGDSPGLSLSFVRDILTISGMTVRETGVPGQGARFEILVPRGIYRLHSPLV